MASERQIEGIGFTVKESKFEFFFGRVTSTPRNRERSLQNARELKRLGIDEAAGGRQKLLKIFEEGLNAPEVIDYRKATKYGLNVARQVEISHEEARGAIIVCYFYPAENTDASAQVTSIIPQYSGHFWKRSCKAYSVMICE